MAEESGADTNEGAAGGDGGGEIAAHSHGKLAQGRTGFGREGVAEFAQGSEGAFSDGGIVGEGGDGHEAVEAQMRFGKSEIEKTWGVFEFGAEFGGVAAGVDLK